MHGLLRHFAPEDARRVDVYRDGCVVAKCAQCSDVIESLQPTFCFYCMAILCWQCWDKTQGVCAGCLSGIQKKRAEIKAELDAMHKSKVGRPTVQSLCKHCGQPFAARVLRKHQPICAKRSRVEEPWSDKVVA